jgi:hypothetical protein
VADRRTICAGHLLGIDLQYVSTAICDELNGSASDRLMDGLHVIEALPEA